MPQLLSKYPYTGFSIGSIGTGMPSERPRISALAMDIIAAWSHVEGAMLSLYITLAGGSKSDAATAYLALNAEAPKRSVVAALAKKKLTVDELAVFDGIIRKLKTCAKDRNKLAHWLWGIAFSLPDSVLLLDPRDFFSGDPSDPDWWANEMPKSIYVYDEADFSEIIRKIGQVARWGITFNHIVSGGYSRDKELDKLIQELGDAAW